MSQTNRLIVPNDVLMHEVWTALKAGSEVTIRAKGHSMAPYIKHDQDNLVINAVDPASLAIGDAVLACDINGRYVMHRIIAIANNGDLTLMGDGNIYGTETAHPDQVLGRLTAIERNGRRIDCNTIFQRRKAAIMSWLYRVPRKIYSRLRRVLGRE